MSENKGLKNSEIQSGEISDIESEETLENYAERRISELTAKVEALKNEWEEIGGLEAEIVQITTYLENFEKIIHEIQEKNKEEESQNVKLDIDTDFDDKNTRINKVKEKVSTSQIEANDRIEIQKSNSTKVEVPEKQERQKTEEIVNLRKSVGNILDNFDKKINELIISKDIKKDIKASFKETQEEYEAILSDISISNENKEDKIRLLTNDFGSYLQKYFEVNNKEEVEENLGKLKKLQIGDIMHFSLADYSVLEIRDNDVVLNFLYSKVKLEDSKTKELTKVVIKKNQLEIDITSGNLSIKSVDNFEELEKDSKNEHVEKMQQKIDNSQVEGVIMAEPVFDNVGPTVVLDNTTVESQNDQARTDREESEKSGISSINEKQSKEDEAVNIDKDAVRVEEKENINILRKLGDQLKNFSRRDAKEILSTSAGIKMVAKGAYNTVTTIAGVKFATDIVLATAGKGDLYNYFQQKRSTKREREAIMDVMNDQEIKDIRAAYEEKINNSKNLSKKEKAELLNTLDTIMEEHQEEENKINLERNEKVQQALDAYLQNKIKGAKIAKDAMYLALTASGFHLTRGAIYLMTSGIERAQKANQQFDKDKANNEVEGKSRVNEILKNVFVNSTKETFRALKGEGKTADSEHKAMDRFQALGTLTRAAGIVMTGIGAESFDVSVDNLLDNLEDKGFLETVGDNFIVSAQRGIDNVGKLKDILDILTDGESYKGSLEGLESVVEQVKAEGVVESSREAWDSIKSFVIDNLNLDQGASDKEVVEAIDNNGGLNSMVPSPEEVINNSKELVGSTAEGVTSNVNKLTGGIGDGLAKAVEEGHEEIEVSPGNFVSADSENVEPLVLEVQGPPAPEIGTEIPSGHLQGPTETGEPLGQATTPEVQGPELPKESIIKHGLVKEPLESPAPEAESGSIVPETSGISKPVHFEDIIDSSKIKGSDSIWRSTRNIFEKNPNEFGYEGNIEDTDAISKWAETQTANAIGILSKEHGGNVADLVHDGDKVVLELVDGKSHLSFEASSGIEAGELSDTNVSKLIEGQEFKEGIEHSSHINSSTGDEYVEVNNGEDTYKIYDWDRDKNPNVIMPDGSEQEMTAFQLQELLESKHLLNSTEESTSLSVENGGIPEPVPAGKINMSSELTDNVEGEENLSKGNIEFNPDLPQGVRVSIPEGVEKFLEDHHIEFKEGKLIGLRNINKLSFDTVGEGENLREVEFVHFFQEGDGSIRVEIIGDDKIDNFKINQDSEWSRILESKTVGGVEKLEQISHEGQMGHFETSSGSTANFEYNANGSIRGVNVNGTLHGRNDLLTDDFRKNITDAWNNSGRHGNLELNIDKVQIDADNLRLNNNVLQEMVDAGQRDTLEAEYLRDSISRTVSRLEKQYGDIIKDSKISDVGIKETPSVEAINNEEIDNLIEDSVVEDSSIPIEKAVESINVFKPSLEFNLEKIETADIEYLNEIKEIAEGARVIAQENSKIELVKAYKDLIEKIDSQIESFSLKQAA